MTLKGRLARVIAVWKGSIELVLVVLPWRRLPGCRSPVFVGLPGSHVVFLLESVLPVVLSLLLLRAGLVVVL